jgi:hypothetical protein
MFSSGNLESVPWQKVATDLFEFGGRHSHRHGRLLFAVNRVRWATRTDVISRHPSYQVVLRSSWCSV